MDRWIELRRVAQAGKDDDPRWYRAHRRLSIHLTRVMLRANFRANQVSGLMMVMAAAGAALLTSLSPAVNVLGFALLYLAFLLDKVDGEIARLRRTQSARGILLDRFHHRIVEPTVFAAAAFHEYRLTSSVAALVAGLVTMLLANVIEENQQLAPFILYKRLREDGHLLESLPLRRSRDLTLAAAVLRPLKAFRMLIVALPLLLLCYLAERASHLPLTTYYLVASAASLGAYLAFQCFYYFADRLGVEMTAMAATFHLGGPGGEEHTRSTSSSAARHAVAAGFTHDSGSGRPAAEPRIGPSGRAAGRSQYGGKRP